ncbi:sigma 54-interacting transcriptional regulator [Photobacterium profundum]|uniref:sigma 54-interacting transcriptional regulator n=1 Tax=Photobacterium profundum TaxID=74109 RepID=UPI003D0A2F66
MKELARDDPFLMKYLPGNDPPVMKVRHQIFILNSSVNRDLIRNVLIFGEPGTGKTYLAQLISAYSENLESRAKGGGVGDEFFQDKPENFAIIDLAGLPESLIESELFGTVKGAFTGARDFTGLLGDDRYKDILLDEIGELPIGLQPKLLRLLNDRKYRKLGEPLSKEMHTDARFILATNRDLKMKVVEGTFRDDLLWRCAEFVITVPPLRDRPEGILQLAKQICGDILRQQNVVHISDYKTSLSAEDIEFVRRYSWPGNIRQLRHSLVRMFAYGNVSLSECALGLESELISKVDCESESECQIREQVSSLLNCAARERKSVASTPGAFVDTNFSLQARKAVAMWLERESPRPATLEVMFPGAKDANSIRSTVLKWRGNK